MLRIVLDTNQLFGRWRLDSPYVTLLGMHAEHGLSEIVAPEIVVQETVNCFTRELEKAMGQYAKAQARVQSFLPERVAATRLPNARGESERYATAFRARLEQLGARVPRYDEIPHLDLVERALKVRRPFRDGDRGYRDSLIWETVLRQVAGRDVEVILVTNNTKDFADTRDSTKLHGDLRQDLKNAGFDPEAVVLVKDINELIDTRVWPDLRAVLDEVVEEFHSGTFGTLDLTEWLSGQDVAIGDSMDGWVEEVVSHVPEFEGPHFVGIEEVGDARVEGVMASDGENGLVVVRGVTEVRALIDGFMYKSEAIFAEDMYPVHVDDLDWNESYARVVLSCEVPLEFTVTVDAKAQNVTGAEFASVEFWGWCPECGAHYASDAVEVCSRCVGGSS